MGRRAKAFASRVSADIFGYCGDAYYPPMILRQVIDQVDNGLLFADHLIASERHAIVVQAFQRALEQRVDTPISSFSVFHAGRDRSGMKCMFRLWEVAYNHPKGQWNDQEHEISGDKSYLVHLDGSGKAAIESKNRACRYTEAKGTSRAAIAALATLYIPARIRSAVVDLTSRRLANRCRQAVRVSVGWQEICGRIRGR